MEDNKIHTQEEFNKKMDSLINDFAENISKTNKPKEERYFISYSAYSEYKSFDIFNTVITVDELITGELIKEIEEDLLKKLNESSETDPYYAVQLISINKI